MAKLEQNSSDAGQPPGMLQKMDKTQKQDISLTFIQYDKEDITIKNEVDFESFNQFDLQDKINWLHINTTYDEEILTKIGDYFDLHDLLLEDIQTDYQRPKIEEFENVFFIVINIFENVEEKEDINTDQLNIVFTDDCLITFQNSDIDFYSPLLARLKNKKSNIRQQAREYLLYALKDFIVDRYFVVLEKINQKLENIERDIIEDPDSQEMQEIYDLKKNLIAFRKSAWPLREIVNKILRDDFEKIDYQKIELYYHDLYDHIIQVMDIIESLRDVLSGLLDLYMSSVSNKMNKVMQFLTIIGTIFIPLTFIAGIYGMNFKYMPELNWEFGYPLIWLIMLIITGIMLMVFKKKDWL